MKWRGMMGNKWRVFLIVFVFVFVFGGVLVGCKGVDQFLVEGKVDLNLKVKLFWMVILYYQQLLKDRVIKEIEKLINIELDIIWVLDVVKEDRLNVVFVVGNFL